VNTSSKVRSIASLVLCIAFFLPISQCSPKMAITQAHPAPVQISAYSVYEWPSVASTIAVALFFWPISVQGFSIIRPRRLQGKKMVIAEVFLCLLTASGITWLIWWGDSIRFGAFVAYGAIVVYSISLIDEIIGLRKKKGSAFQKR
jgi:hypothetical protein